MSEGAGALLLHGLACTLGDAGERAVGVAVEGAGPAGDVDAPVWLRKCFRDDAPELVGEDLNCA